MKVTFFLPSFCCRDSRFAVNRKCRLAIWVAVILGICLFLTQLIYTLKVSIKLDLVSTLKSDDISQYAVVIDAGSSGSRVYIYLWPPHSGNVHELLNIKPMIDKSGVPIMKKIEPGLSSIANEPAAASEYIYPLLEFARNKIPPQLHLETPVYILATAGLRLLNSTQQAFILEDLRHDIPKLFNFSFSSSNVEVISGKQEAVYQWMAINYAFQRFNHKMDAPLIAVDVDGEDAKSTPFVYRKQTLGILDMGGASMQIGFELTKASQLNSLNADKKIHLAEFNLGCLEHLKEHVYHVYVTTYLGLGANSALTLYEKNATSFGLIDAAKMNKTSILLPHPCFPYDFMRTEIRHNISVKIRGEGELIKCRDRLKPLFKNLSDCPGDKCVFAFIKRNYEDVEWIGFSEFWYSMEDILKIGGSYSYYKILKAYNEFCSTKWSILQHRFDAGQYPIADKNRLRNQCFKLAWITLILHDGLGLPYDFSHLNSSPNTVSGQIVHWTLGAILFRTRFIPLRAVQQNSSSHHIKSSSYWFLYLNHYILFGCFLLVIMSILLYLRGLRKWCFKRKRNNILLHQSHDIISSQSYA